MLASIRQSTRAVMVATNDGAAPRSRRGCLLALVGTVVLFLLCSGGALYLGSSLLVQDTREIGPDAVFSSDAWRVASEESNDRLTMLRDLVHRVGVIGRSRSELEAMLGPPTYESWSDSYPHPGYALGFGRIDWFDGPCTTPLILVYNDEGACVGYWAYYDGEIADGRSARAPGW